MLHDAMCEVIDRLIEDSGMTEEEAFDLVGQMLEEEAPLFMAMMPASTMMSYARLK